MESLRRLRKEVSVFDFLPQISAGRETAHYGSVHETFSTPHLGPAYLVADSRFFPVYSYRKTYQLSMRGVYTRRSDWERPV